MLREISQYLQTSHSFTVTEDNLTFTITSLSNCNLSNHSRTFFIGTLSDCYTLLLRFWSPPKSTLLGNFLITSDDGTFGYSRYLDHKFVAELIYEGYLPISTRDDGLIYILAKLHSFRSVITLGRIRVPKTVKKRKKEFKLVVNHDYNKVCEGVRKVHGEGWLYPEISELYRRLKESNYLPGLEIVTIELYKNDLLVAGELGYTLGNIYSSLTGFYDKDYPGSGKVQLEALRCLLIKKGIKYWDLGMEMEYKTEMGAVGIPRSEWLDLVRNNRDLKCESLDNYNSGPDLEELFSSLF